MSPLDTSLEQVVKTAEALYALLHNGLEHFQVRVQAQQPPHLPGMLGGKELFFSIKGPQDSLESAQPIMLVAGSPDLRGWLVQQVRQGLIEQMVGRSADRTGYALRKLGPGKCTLSITLRTPKIDLTGVPVPTSGGTLLGAQPVPVPTSAASVTTAPGGSK